MDKPVTTQDKWSVQISGNDTKGFDWKVTWREGSETSGWDKTFEEANARVAAEIKLGEQPL